MNVDLGIWSKLTRLLLVLVVVAGVLAVVVWYLPLFHNNEAMRKRILDVNEQIQQEELRGRALENSIRALRNDPREVERLARQKLGYARSGETVFVFETPATNAVSVQP